jgi:hypothetical protein
MQVPGGLLNWLGEQYEGQCGVQSPKCNRTLMNSFPASVREGHPVITQGRITKRQMHTR